MPANDQDLVTLHKRIPQLNVRSNCKATFVLLSILNSVSSSSKKSKPYCTINYGNVGYGLGPDHGHDPCLYHRHTAAVSVAVDRFGGKVVALNYRTADAAADNGMVVHRRLGYALAV